MLCLLLFPLSSTFMPSPILCPPPGAVRASCACNSSREGFRKKEIKPNQSVRSELCVCWGVGERSLTQLPSVPLLYLLALQGPPHKFHLPAAPNSSLYVFSSVGPLGSSLSPGTEPGWKSDSPHMFPSLKRFCFFTSFQCLKTFVSYVLICLSL